jgi:spore germination protein YaaH
MDIVAPQTYAVKADGTLLGKPNPEILRIAYNSGASMMPLVVNQHFSQSLMHELLVNGEAQDKLISALIAEAKDKKYIGFQYDFEHMSADDKDLYSAFVERSAPRFREAGLQFSVAVSPKHSDDKAVW